MKRPLIVLLLFLLVPTALAQTTGGNLEGIVRLPDQSPLPGAVLRLECSGKRRFRAISDSNGFYRFLRIPTGDCRLTVSSPGFLSQSFDVSIPAGETRLLHVTLRPGHSGTIEVKASPLGTDPRHTTIQSTLHPDELYIIPNAHDPWSLLELAPGIVVREVNIGGSRSGEQAYFYGHGEARNNAQWFLDGIMITDHIERGGSTRYIDFASFETVQITTGGADVEAFTGGVTVNIISRQAGNRWTTGGRLFFTGNPLQASNINPLEMPVLERGENEIARFIDYGVNLGGPIVRDRVFGLLSFGGQSLTRNAPTFTDTVNEATTLQDAMFRLTTRWPAHHIDFQVFFGRRNVNHAEADFDRTPLTTLKISKTSPLLKLQHEWIPNSQWFVTTRVAGTPGQKEKEFPLGGIHQPAVLDLATGVWDRSIEWIRLREPIYQASLQVQYFGSRLFGAENEWKWGLEARYLPVTLEKGIANGLVIVFDDRQMPAQGGEVRLFRPQNVKPWLWKLAVYAQDRLNFKRLSLYAGIRADLQTTGRRAATVDANPFLPELLPAGRDPGGRLNFRWLTLSPRVGFTYDLLGDQRLLLKVSSALYPANLDTRQAVAMSPTALREIDFRWDRDRNNDGFPDPDEFNGTNPIFWDHQPGNPNRVVNAVDADFASPLTFETLIGGEWSPLARWRLQGFFIYRRNFRRKESFPFDPEHPGDVEQFLNCWFIAGYIPAQFGGWPYYACDRQKPMGEIWMNQPRYHRDYWGAEVRIQIRPTRALSLTGSFNWERFVHHFKGRRAFVDPTNIEQLDRGAVAFGGANIRWMAKLLVSLQLPGDFRLGTIVQMRDGFPFLARYRVTRPSNGWGRTVDVLTAKSGTLRLPDLIFVHMRLQKTFHITPKARLTAVADVFNLFNTATPLKKNTRADDPVRFGQVEAVLAPRVIRLGLRFES